MNDDPGREARTPASGNKSGALPVRPAENDAVDLEPGPFSVPPVATIPFDRESEEARAIRAVIERVDESPFSCPPVEGIPFEQDGTEARAIRAVIEESERARREPRE